MLEFIITQLLLISFSYGDIDHFIEYCTVHKTEINEVLYETPMPNKLVNELEILLKMDIGKKLHRTCTEDKKKFTFIEVKPENAYTADENNSVYYSLNVRSWYAYKITEMEIPKSSNLENVPLGALIAHEIGHTPMGRKALGLDAINPYMSSNITDDNVTVVFSRKKIREEEIRAVRQFENPYRKFIGYPLRHSYYEECDVTGCSNR